MRIVPVVTAADGDTDEANVNEIKGAMMMLNLVWMKNCTETDNNNVIAS